MVTKLDRLARPVRDARDIADELTTKGVELFNVSRATVYRELQRRRAAFFATCEAHVF